MSMKAHVISASSVLQAIMSVCDDIYSTKILKGQRYTCTYIIELWLHH